MKTPEELRDEWNHRDVEAMKAESMAAAERLKAAWDKNGNGRLTREFSPPLKPPNE